MPTSSAEFAPDPRGEALTFLHDYFETQVHRTPDHAAIEFEGEVLTYAELDLYANRIARALVRRGVGPKTLVAIYLEKSPRLFAALLGVLKAGAAYVPLDPKFPIERIEDILDDSRSVVVISEGTLAQSLAGAAAPPILRLDQDANAIAAEAGEPLRAADAGLTPKHLCYVIYTSGSTGRPKGVMIEHRNATAFVRTIAPVYRLAADDRIYQGFSTAFDASVEEVWAAFSTGATLVVAPEHVARSPLDAAEFITANRLTYFSTVPTFLSMIDRELPTVRTLVLGGEVCTQELVARWAKRGRRMLNTYGPTEATVVATWTECVPGEPVTIGTGLPGYSTYVLDENDHPVAPGEVGELCIGGLAVARGYLNQPELTAERFTPKFKVAGGKSERIYRTRDLVRLKSSGALEFVGRTDGQIKIRGFRVELSEIEAVLLQHAGINAAAVRVTEAGGMKELAAYVVLNHHAAELDRLRLAELLRSRLPEYMIPKYLDVVAELPLMTSGKVDRNRLPEPVLLLKGANREIVPPADDLEQTIALTWRDSFGIPAVSVVDDFFLDLGGHSLLAATTVNKLRRKLGSSRISVRDIYTHRTIRGLAVHWRSLGIGESEAWPSDIETKALTPSRIAFSAVHPLERWTVVALQAISLLAFYGIVAAPLAYVVLMVTAVVDGDISANLAIWISTAVGFAVWPVMLLLSIAVKWLVIGRYRPGRYPLWSFYYFRWWLVTRFQVLSWSDMFAGTPLMSFYYRAMGAKVGKNVTLSTALCSAFDLVAIGDRASIGSETQLLGYRVENGMLIIGRVEIGRDCFVGTHCCLGLNTRMQENARLDDMSLLEDGAELDAGKGWRGAPTKPAHVPVPGHRVDRLNPRRPILFGALHLALIYLMGYLLLLSVTPAAVLIAGALYLGGPEWGIPAAFGAVPLSLFWYAILAVAMRRVIGRIEAGTYPIESRQYLRHWFLEYLLRNTRTILLPVYATIYLPYLLRLLGAKIGKGVEISTVSQVSPDLLEVGNGSFLADGCIVGGQRIHRGLVEIGAVRIGQKTFVGNSAFVSGGHELGNNVLIGVMSSPPAGKTTVEEGSAWLGSPGFELPRRQNETCFADSETFAPGRRARRTRALIDALRIFIPGLVGMASLVAFASLLVLAYRELELLSAVAIVPLVAAMLAGASIGIIALLKHLCLGTLEPAVKPLWCRFVWINELVNGAYESVAAQLMAPMMGTPFIAPCLRRFGCKIGKWCFIETTLFSEFDLVEVGNHAALNLGSTIQTHLFEDRIMKADYLRIGEGCSVGNMAIVLYGTEMGAGSCLAPLSVLMKGETLPEHTRWQGIPCEQTGNQSIAAGHAVASTSKAGWGAVPQPVQ